MKALLFQFGKTKDKNIEAIANEYIKRINRFCPFKTEILSNVKITGSNYDIIKQKECEILFHKAKSSDIVVLLDESGEQFNSISFAKHYSDKISRKKNGDVIFVIGGAHGFSEQAKEQADFLVSLSKMTFSHQLVRIIFLEQFYRMMTILNNHPYHNN